MAVGVTCVSVGHTTRASSMHLASFMCETGRYCPMQVAAAAFLVVRRTERKSNRRLLAISMHRMSV